MKKGSNTVMKVRGSFWYRFKEILLRYGEKWDALAPMESEAIRYAHMYINEEPERKLGGTLTLSPMYRIASSQQISQRLRSGTATDIDLELIEALKPYTLKNNIVVYRGVFEDDFNNMIVNAKEIGNCDLYEKGLYSTSIVKGKQESQRSYQLRTFLPKGTNAIYLGNVNYEEKAYYEVLVQKGAKLKIVSMDNSFINCILLSTD